MSSSSASASSSSAGSRVTTFSLIAIIAILSSILDSVIAAPSTPELVYPLQAQRPPVARIGQSFSWSLLPGTFNSSSTQSSIILSAQGLPSWLDFDPVHSEFSGNPRSRDVGSKTITVFANATGVPTGAFDRWILLVVDGQDPGPTIVLPIAQQLSSAAYQGGGASLLNDGSLKVPPRWSFSLGFQQFTFRDSVNQYATVYYTAYQLGTTTLPNWLNFDNKTVTFGGNAPATPGDTTIVLYGSDYYGYGDVEQTFTIRVGNHILNQVEPFPNLSTTPDDLIDYVLPIDGLRIDNSTVNSSSIESIQFAFPSNLSSFLSFDSGSRTISGSVPSTFAAPQTFVVPVTIVDTFNDTLIANLTISVYMALFTTSTIPSIQVIEAKPFTTNLSSFTSSKTAIYSASIDPASAQQWITFNPTSLSLSGTAPSTIQNISVVLTGVEEKMNLTSRADLTLQVVSSLTASTSSIGSKPTSTQGSNNNSKGGLSRSVQLGLGIGLGLGLGLIFLTLLGICCWKRRKDQKDRPYSTVYRRSFGATTPATFKSGRSSTVFGSMFENKSSEKIDDERRQSDVVWAAPVPPVDYHDQPLTPRTEQSMTPRPNVMIENDAHSIRSRREEVISTSPIKPKRFDIMEMFRSATANMISTVAAVGATAGIYGSHGAAGGAGMGQTDKSMISLPIQPSQHSIDGLGIDESESTPRMNQHEVVNMNEGHYHQHTGTFVPAREGESESELSDASRLGEMSSGGLSSRRDETGLERSSTWESGGSSSLFYSDASDNDSRRRNNTGNNPGRPRAPRSPPSQPRQRKDFQPLVPPPVVQSSSHTFNDSMSSSVSSDALRSQSDHESSTSQLDSSANATGIRLVGSHSDSSNGTGFPTSSTTGSSQMQHHPQELRHVQESNSLGSTSFHSSARVPSIGPARLLPFTQQRGPTASQTSALAFSSQTALRDPTFRHSAIEDADESSPIVAPAGGTRISARPKSAVYEPPASEAGDRTTSVVIFPSSSTTGHSERHLTTTTAMNGWMSPSGHSEFSELGDSVRLVGSVAGSPYMRTPRTGGAGGSLGPAAPTSGAWHYPSSYTATSTIYSRQSRPQIGLGVTEGAELDADSNVVRVQVNVNEPFRFMIPLPLNPSGSSSTSFEAYIDAAEDASENRQRLPDWVQFDEGGTKEISGCARRGDNGVLPIIILERFNASRENEFEEEEYERVVARYEIEVGWREPDSLTHPDGEDPEGELAIITF